jgi:ABC-type branched-subunit amino acid transport system ATPase component/ABC-type branched-subunit amino acid transport system permease subunit
VGGLFLGVAGSLATKYVVNVPWLIGLPASLPFIVLFVVLLVTPKNKLLTRSHVTPRTIPRSWHAPVRIRVTSGAAFVIFLCFIPALVGTNLANYTSTLILVILILSLGLLVRTSRQVSLCQYAFAAIGASSMAHFTSFGIPWLASLFLAASVVIPVGALLAIPAIRLSGVFLALATLGFGIFLEQMIYTQSWMFGANSNGLPTTRPSLNLGPIHLGSDESMYYVVLIFVVLVAVGIAVLSETRLGKLLRAMGDSPLALDTYGLNVSVIRVVVFCISAFIAAIAGALTASVNTFALGDNFPSFSSITLVVVVIVVVIGEPWYAFIGAAILTLVPVYFTGSNVGNLVLVAFAIAGVLVPVYRHKIQLAPRAITDFIDKVGARPARRALTVPEGRVVSASRAQRPTPSTNLSVENLTVRYGGAIAVDKVNLAVRAGTITGLIGPNGAGKTTTFNACSGIVRPAQGRIVLHHVDITRASLSERARLGLGRTFQRVQLFESLDVRTNVALARECALAGSNPVRQVVALRSDGREIDASTAAAVELTGIEDFLDARVERLSTGQRRLVELARVLAGPFDTILLDEPSSGLDATETENFGEILKRVVDEMGVGLLLVEHDMALVQQTCEQVYVLDFGEMIFEGTAQKMLASEIVREAYLGRKIEGIELEPTGTDAATARTPNPV